MWEVVEAGYKIATVAMMLMCSAAMALTQRTLDLLAAAGVVFTFTLMSMWVVDTYPAPWHSVHMIVQDAICAAVAWWAAKRTTERWPHWLKIAFTVQCGIHVAYWGGLFTSATVAGGAWDGLLTRTYPWPINTLFVIQLAILTVAGGGYVARGVRDRLRRVHLRPAAFPGA